MEMKHTARKADLHDELVKSLMDARNYIQSTVINATSSKTKTNYRGCLERIDAVLAKAQEV